MKKITAIFAVLFTAALLAATLAGCAESPEPVTETSRTAFENHTIMPRVAEEEETERERPANEFGEEDYDEDEYEYIEERENDEYKYDVYEEHIIILQYWGVGEHLDIPA